jgi:hypothetical protein
MANPASDKDQEFSGSKLKPLNGYGQNGYQGASSEVHGKRVTSGFLPQSSVPSGGWQTRSVDQTQYPAAHGMKGPKTGEKIPAKTNRR